jgi:hypothetical protein
MVAAGGPGGVRVPANAKIALVLIMANVVAATVAQWVAMEDMFIVFSFYDQYVLSI